MVVCLQEYPNNLATKFTPQKRWKGGLKQTQSENNLFLVQVVSANFWVDLGDFRWFQKVLVRSSI